jgi:hypothetical protein
MENNLNPYKYQGCQEKHAKEKVMNPNWGSTSRLGD